MINPQRNSDSHPARKRKIIEQPSSADVNQIAFPQIPDELVENVFSFLTIQHAAQIGAFSKKFNSSWLHSRKLFFGRDFTQEWDRKGLVVLLNRIFESHKGSKIETFNLCIDPEGEESSIEKWVRFCIEKGLEQLELDFNQTDILPLSFLDIQTLKYLKLTKCEIELPPVLSGLRFLHTLILRQLELTQEQLETMLSNTDQLVTLDLAIITNLRQVNVSARQKNFKLLKIACCFDLEGITIDAPSLRTIFFTGAIPIIKLSRGTHLEEVFINFVPKSKGKYIQPAKLEHLIDHFSHVVTLTTSCMLVEALTTRYRHGMFIEKKFCLRNLKELQLFVDQPTFCNPYDISLFLKGCPFLVDLFIEINDCHFEEESYWKLHQNPVIENTFCYLYRLKFVKLVGYNFQHYGVELVKLILKRAINLDTLILIPPKYRRFKISPHLLSLYTRYFQYWKTSPVAKIHFFKHPNDKTVSPTHASFWV